MKLTNIKVPYEPGTLASQTTPSVPLKSLRELHFYEDPDYIRMFIRRTGYRYAPYYTLPTLGEMPELKKLILSCKKDSQLREYDLLGSTISDHFKSQKFNKLEILAVGYEQVNVEGFKLVSTAIKELHLFGFEDSALILEIWNTMSKTEVETISIGFEEESYYTDNNLIEGVLEYQKTIQPIKSLKHLILSYEKIKMPLKWYRNFFRALNDLISLEIKWLRKDVLKSAIRMLPKLKEIHYEKFYDLSEQDDDDDLYANDESESGDEFGEVKDLEAYYKLISELSVNVNKNVKISRKVVKDKFIVENS